MKTTTSGHIIARNTLMNIAGRIIALIVGLAAIPILVKGLGADRYGLLALFWVIIGYLGLLDMGIGRTTTKFVAERLANNRTDDIPGLVWTSWWMLLGLGFVAGLVLVVLAPILTEHVLRVPVHLNREASVSMHWLALMLPLIMSTAGMQGFLEARQRFDIINAIQLPTSISGYAIPIAILFYTKDLSIIIIGSLIVKIIVWAVFFWCCLRDMPALRTCWKLSGRHLGEMFRFGGWLTVSNVVSPLMTNLDRFLIGALVSLQAVAYYTVPYSLVTQLWVIPTSLIPVLFPVFTGLVANRDPILGQMYRQSVKSVFLVLAPVVIGLMGLSDDVLTVWLGSEFSMKSSAVMTILALGVLVNSLAHVPFSLIQASGRPDITAKFHLLEIVPYVASVWWATVNYGILGTAVAWLLRVSVDAALLFWFANLTFPKEQQGLGFVLVMVLMIVFLYGITVAAISGIQSVAGHFAIVLAILGLVYVTAWRFWLTKTERATIADWRALLARQRA